MSGKTARLTALLVLATLALAAAASSGKAASPARAQVLGVVPHAGRPTEFRHALPQAFPAASPSSLAFDASYESLIDRYLTDVAVASGATDNVYSVATQYDDAGSAHIQYQSTFGGSYVDKDPLPTSGCNDGADPYCLTDAQLANEIQTVLAAKGWTGGLDHMFFLMTPYGVGSCFYPGGTTVPNQGCSSQDFCAYHSAYFDPSHGDVIYANEPYLGPSAGCSNPDEQGFPNDVDSDTTINTISHEHNEAITDPFGDGWIAADGSEVADLCAYGFGASAGTAGVDAYNQVINGHHYDLQQEYSNTDGGCVQSLGGTPLPPPTGDGTPPLTYGGGSVMHTNTTYTIYWLPTPGRLTFPAVTGTAAVRQTLTSSLGTWNGAPTSYAYRWQRCASLTATCVDIPGATGSSYTLTTADGGEYVRSTVSATNVNGSSPPSQSASQFVVPFPLLTKAPHIAGRARVGRRLSASKGLWSGAPTAYRFQWLRCNSHGVRCGRIGAATHSTYKLGKHDAKHRLRVRVTAANVAGSVVATSNATARVPAKKH